LVEKPTTCARVNDSLPFTFDSKARTRRVLIFADDDDRPRAHMLLLAYDGSCFPVAEIREGLRRMLQEVAFLVSLGRRHGRWQIDEPLGIGREATHDLQGCGRIDIPDGDP